MGVLIGQTKNGMNTICFYSDSGVINAKYDLCPLTN